MKDIYKTRIDKMGLLNNRIVELIDKSQLTPPEVAIILRTLADKIEKLFLLSILPEEK